MAWPLTLGAISFFLAVVWGGPLIHLLKEHRLGKQIRIEEPTKHQIKTGTPTMGGIMVIVPVVLITAALNIASLVGSTPGGRSILMPMGALVAFGLLGAADDLAGIRGVHKGTGILGRYKFLWEALLSIAIAIVLRFILELHSVAIPTIVQKIDIDLIYIPVAAFFIVGFSNAVNLTDGLDS
ncbi:MAG: phospho-N-acetylmuramoyl-pentapeptide-transferase, partial [Chloroflexota bacterium]|nr:phospho-N-acetylmuramoyl-pentapeptide-transferase [Chloroflexota bacterium]